MTPDPAHAFHWGMNEDVKESTSRPSSTQIGAIGEALVASGLILGSGGRIAPFSPFADDGGVDLLVYDKVTHQSLPVQIKCRTGLDDRRAGTVQFDVRLSTFARQANGYVLCALLDGHSIATAWLIPAVDIAAHARWRENKLVVVASTKPSSSDRYAVYRSADLGAVAHRLLTRFDAQMVSAGA